MQARGSSKLAAGPGGGLQLQVSAGPAGLTSLTHPHTHPLTNLRTHPPTLQVDPVFEGLDGGAGSLIKYNPLTNITSAEVWNFLRVMVSQRARQRAAPAGLEMGWVV